MMRLGEGASNLTKKNENPSQSSRSFMSRAEKTQSELRRSADYSEHGQRQAKMTEFFEVLNQYDLIIAENEDLKQFVKFLTEKVKSFVTNAQNMAIISEMPALLQALVKSHEQNKDKKKGGERYKDELIRNFCMLSKDLGGKQLYEFWTKNLPIPSATSVTSHSRKTSKKINEGEFRFEELVEYMDALKLPRIVWMSEDASRCIPRIEYDEKSNQLLGFVPDLDDNGLPKVLSFEATSAEMIKNVFKSGKLSNYIYVIMAQPLAEVPAFCLCVYGTDSKFDNEQVSKRWQWTQKEAQRHGLIISGLSADGDEKLLLAMKRWMFRSQGSVLPGWEKFFFAPMDLENPPCNELQLAPVCIQDIVHIGAKFKTQCLKSRSDTDFMPMGEYVVSGTFLEILVNEYSKLDHGLCLSDLDAKDKMNFRSVQKISDDRVLNALDQIPGSDGLKVYLLTLRGILDAFLNKDISTYKRVFLSWRSVFLLRFWRAWLQINKKSVSKQFITRNTYECVEISVQSMINVIRRLRIYNKPHLFLPWLMGSQPCEGLFRSARSCTTVFHTAVNVSSKGFIERVDKIERITRTTHELNKTVVVPKHHKRMQESHLREESAEENLPDDTALFKSIMEAKADAVCIAKKIGMVGNLDVETAPSFITNILDNIITDYPEEENEEEDEPSGNDGSDIISDSMPLDVAEDIVLENEFPVEVDCQEKSTNLVVEENGECRVMKKKTFVWLLSSRKYSISSNRLERVKAACETLESPDNERETSKVSVSENLSLGEWAVFDNCPLPNRVYVGRILEFSYLSGKGKARQYTNNMVPLAEPIENARGIGCMGYWFALSLQGSGTLHKLHEPHKFHNVRDYLCTMPRPSFGNGLWFFPDNVIAALKNALSGHHSSSPDSEMKKTYPPVSGASSICPSVGNKKKKVSSEPTLCSSQVNQKNVRASTSTLCSSRVKKTELPASSTSLQAEKNVTSIKPGRSMFPDSDSDSNDSECSKAGKKRKSEAIKSPRKRGRVGYSRPIESDSDSSTSCRSPKASRKADIGCTPLALPGRQRSQSPAFIKVFPPLPRLPLIDEFVLVEFITRNKSKPKYYVAKVLKEADEVNDLEVTYLRCSSTIKERFSLPPVHDIASVHVDCIKMILTKPNIEEDAGRRQKGLYHFSETFEGLDVG